jgi:hypothetical protein
VNGALASNPATPCLVELSHEGPCDAQAARRIPLLADHYDLGSDKFLAASQPNNYIRLDAAAAASPLERRHCSLTRATNNRLLFTPHAECYVNKRSCTEPTQLLNNFTIRLGQHCLFRVALPETGHQDTSLGSREG